MLDTDTTLYTVGGAVQAGEGIYIPRQADADLLAWGRAGMYAYVLAPRQVGKSSLMIHTAAQLAFSGIRTVLLDLTAIGTQVAAADWYFGLLYANAIDKSKQKKSMSDLRTIGTAVEAYATDTAVYPQSIPSWATLKPIVDPYFIRMPPDADGWSNGWDASTTSTGSDYTLASYGKDGILSSRPGGQTTDFNCDIVFSHGQFYQWPEGTQS